VHGFFFICVFSHGTPASRNAEWKSRYEQLSAVRSFLRKKSMTVASVMTDTPVCCTPKSTLTEVAKMMVDNDCGQIPVVENLATRKLAGVITDRDITTRIVAEGKNSSEAFASDCMSSPCITVKPEDSIQSCCALMEANKIRRVPVVNANDEVVGIVSLADVARHENASTTASVVKEVSSVA